MPANTLHVCILDLGELCREKSAMGSIAKKARVPEVPSFGRLRQKMEATLSKRQAAVNRLCITTYQAHTTGERLSFLSLHKLARAGTVLCSRPQTFLQDLWAPSIALESDTGYQASLAS